MRNKLITAALTTGLAAGTAPADVVTIGVLDDDVRDIIGQDLVVDPNALLGVLSVGPDGPLLDVDPLLDDAWRDAKKKKTKRKVKKPIKGGKDIRTPKDVGTPKPSTPSTCCGLGSDDAVHGWHLDPVADQAVQILDFSDLDNGQT